MKRLALFTTCICTCVAAFANEPIELKLGRGIKAFDHYELRGSSTRISRVQVRDEKNHLEDMQADTITVRISAICDVQNVTTDGQEAIKSVKINYAYIEHNGQTSELLPSGAKLNAKFSDTGTSILKDSVPLPSEVMASLVAVIRSEGGKRTGEILDPKKMVSIGDSWSINVKAFKNTFDEGGRKIAKAVKGKVNFIKVDSTGRMPVAVVEMKATAQNAVGDMGGVKPTSSNLQAEVLLHVPIDQRYPATRTASFTKVIANFGKGKGSAVVEFTVSDDIYFER